MVGIRSGRFARGVLIASLLGWAGAIPAVAQTRVPARAGMERDTTREELTPSPTTLSLLDGPISRSDYRLGAGDVLNLSLFGGRNEALLLSVTPEGTVVLPGLGVVGVGGLNLHEAQRRVDALLARFYHGVQSHLTLAQVRTFKVFVAGAVAEPGVRPASSTTRVSELVPLRGQDGILHRNILLARTGGDTLTVDLARFANAGDVAANPHVREGDAIVVPTTDRTVHVFGPVAFAGVYQFKNGETLAELLQIAAGGGELPSGIADSVRITRFVDASRREVFIFSRDEATGSVGQDFRLHPFDAIYLSGISNFKEQRTARVTGQVQRPGEYPIVPGETTVRDLVRMAGGFTAEASLSGAILNRSEGTESRRNDLEAIPPELLSTTERQILQIRSRGEATNVVLDFQRLFEQGIEAFDQPLRDGDELHVPRQRNQVAVLGAVRHPGLLGYVEGEDVGYYVSLAGGYGRRADRGDAVVLKGPLGTRIDARDVESLGPGDVVVIPFKERPDPLEILQRTNIIVTSVTGLVLTFLAVF